METSLAKHCPCDILELGGISDSNIAWMRSSEEKVSVDGLEHGSCVGGRRVGEPVEQFLHSVWIVVSVVQLNVKHFDRHLPIPDCEFCVDVPLGVSLEHKLLPGHKHSWKLVQV